MPPNILPLTQQEHRAKAQRNRNLCDRLDASDIDFPEWRFVVRFYALMHEVDEFLKRSNNAVRHDPARLRSHMERNERLRNDHPDVWKKYEPRYNDSVVARYGSVSMIRKFNRKYFRKLEEEWLPEIEDLIRPPADNTGSAG